MAREALDGYLNAACRLGHTLDSSYRQASHHLAPPSVFGSHISGTEDSGSIGGNTIRPTFGYFGELAKKPFQ